MQEKNILQYIKILFISNAIMAIAIVGGFCYLILNNPNTIPAPENNIISARKNQSLPSKVPATQQIANDQPTDTAKSGDTSQKFVVQINDDGFVNQGLQGFGNENTKFFVTNNGKKEHSFAIKDLEIDSGPIKPGETKELPTIALPNITKNYFFTSSANNELEKDFKGILMVLKNDTSSEQK